MLKKLIVLISAISLAAFFVGCSGDGDNPVDPQVDPQPQEIVIKQVEIPASMQQNQEIDIRTLSFLTMANTVSLYSGLYSTPGTAQLSGNNEWSGTWGDGETTYLWNSWQDEGTYYVELNVSGIYNGITVSDYRLVELEAWDEGNAGMLTIFDPVDDEVYYEWNTDQSDVYYLSMFFPEESELYVRSNPDLSGKMEYYEYDGSDSVLIYQAEWQSDGSGNWISYDLNGDQTGSGNW